MVCVAFEQQLCRRVPVDVADEAPVHAEPAEVLEVAGEAFYTGEASFTCEPEDPLGAGFLLRR